MRIKFNCTEFEAEVLDAKGEPIYHVAGERYYVELDIDKMITEGVSLARKLEDIANEL